MTVHVKADQPANTSLGIHFTEPGQVIAIDDHTAAEQLLRIEGFSEVVPSGDHGRHEVPPPAPTADDPADGDDPVDEDGGDKSKPAKGARGKAVTE